MSPTPAAAPKQPTRTGWAPLLTSVAFFMVTLDSLVVVTALPAIHRELGGQVSTLEWAVNAYLLVFAAAIITAASTGERSGRRRVYVAGLALFSLASRGRPENPLIPRICTGEPSPTTRSHDDVRPDPRHRSDRLRRARRPYRAPADPADARPPHIV